mmetsp:Transcript_16284/g.33881  ORF Transcript_16284/g.33881 Transcript_16284/m.33881 type:complete len:287 (+) Transcript_16284:200-1060(+)
MPLVAPLVVAVAHRSTIRIRIRISFHHNAVMEICMAMAMAMVTTTGGVTTIAATVIAAAVDHRTIGTMVGEEEAVGTCIEETCTETVVDEIETETTDAAATATTLKAAAAATATATTLTTTTAPATTLLAAAAENNWESSYFVPTTRNKTGPTNAAANARPVPPSSMFPPHRSNWRRTPRSPWPPIPAPPISPGFPRVAISPWCRSKHGTPVACTLATFLRTCTNKNSTTFFEPPSTSRGSNTKQTTTTNNSNGNKDTTATTRILFCRSTSTTNDAFVSWNLGTWP